jgi:hypothetical protein
MLRGPCGQATGKPQGTIGRIAESAAQQQLTAFVCLPAQSQMLLSELRPADDVVVHDFIKKA